MSFTFKDTSPELLFFFFTATPIASTLIPNHSNQIHAWELSAPVASCLMLSAYSPPQKLPENNQLQSKSRPFVRSPPSFRTCPTTPGSLIMTHSSCVVSLGLLSPQSHTVLGTHSAIINKYGDTTPSSPPDSHSSLPPSPLASQNPHTQAWALP